MELFNAAVYGAGLGILAVFFWCGVFALTGWIAKGVGFLYRKARHLPKPEAKETTRRLTWSDGWRERGQIADKHEAWMEKRLEHQREETERYFNKYLDLVNPQRVADRKAAETKAVESPLVEPDHAQEQIDTDE